MEPSWDRDGLDHFQSIITLNLGGWPKFVFFLKAETAIRGPDHRAQLESVSYPVLPQLEAMSRKLASLGKINLIEKILKCVCVLLC